MTIAISPEDFDDLVAGHYAIPTIPVDCVVVRSGDRELQCTVVNSGLDRTSKQLILTLTRKEDCNGPAAAEDAPARPQINPVANGEADDYPWHLHRDVRESFHP